MTEREMLILAGSMNMSELQKAIVQVLAERDKYKADADRLASALYGIVGIEPGDDTEAFCAAIELAAPSEHEKTIAMNAIAALAAHERGEV